jgi:predicted nucleic acid-binding protein
MALILDTNALSAFADGDDALRAAIAGESELALSVIALGEYYFGIRQSRHRARYETWLRSHLSLFTLVTIGPSTALRYAEIREELKSEGRPIPSNDVWIAAQARESGQAVLSRDRHFALVRGLKLVNW